MSDDRLARPEWRGRTNVDALTIACIEHAEDIKRKRWPKRPDVHHEFVVTQGSYQSGGGDENSAGTHDRGGVVDLRWCGHEECVRALRLAGTTASHRNPQQGPWPDHIHLVVIGHPDLAPAAARQVEAYLANPPLNGLSDNGPDDGPRLNPIPRPVWPWPKEDDMAQYDQLLNGIDGKLDRIIDKINASRDREVRTNALLRKIRDENQVADKATRAEIEELLAEVKD